MLGDSWHTLPEKEKKFYKKQARKLAKKNSTKAKSAVSTVILPRRPVGRPPLYTNIRRNESITALDCAAHLKLLGESLTTIGARLQEHRGKIAVQGSLSVLFDSLLCVMGTMMCMTTQVPQLNGCPEQLHVKTLDNIAYIMPGVG